MPRRTAVRRKPKSRKQSDGEHAAESALLERNLPVLSRSMTFGRMVKENNVFRFALKDLRWLFPPLCQRKDQAVMTESERARYLCAFNMINSDGTLGQFVDAHAEMHM